MVNKKDNRRVVCGTCLVVAPSGEGSSAAAAPSKVTVSVRRRRGCCGWLAGPWKELAAFSFSDRARAPFFDNAFLDLERVLRYNRKADAAAAQVKICVTLRSGATRVARVGLDDFMDQLLQSGQPEWFVLCVHEGKVVLRPAHTPLPEVPTGWPYDGVASDTRRGQKGGKNRTSNDPKVTGPEESQGKTDTNDQGLENIAPPNDSARKAEELCPAEDKESDVAETEKETPEETFEDITVNDEEKESLSDKEESGRGDDDSDESDWETLKVTAYTGEESDLDTDEGTDGEAECEADAEDSEDSKREPDEDTGKTDEDTGETDEDTGETDEDTEETDEETEWEADDEETERDSDEDSDGSGGETSEDDAEEDTGEGPGSERGSVLARLGAALRHHSRSLLVAAEVALIIVTLKVWGPPAYLAIWRWGGAGGEL